MRFLTTLHKAGRLEYLAVSVVCAIATYALAIYVLQFGIDIDTSSAGAAQDTLTDVTFSASALGIWALGMVFIYFVWAINTVRRLKDLNFSAWMVLVLFVPLIGLVFNIYLFFASGISDKTYTPYGNDPYDPNSWVPPEEPTASGTAVSYNGQDVYLPGEEAWNHGDQAA